MMQRTPLVFPMPLAFSEKKEKKEESFLQNMVVGGSIGALAKTVMSPVERVKILMQTMDSNPRVISGEIKPYTGVMDCFRRVASEQGIGAFWRGNLVNCLRYAPQQGSALAFNDFFNGLFPKVDKNKQIISLQIADLQILGLI